MSELGRARADVVGSLLRPAYLRDARKAALEGRSTEADLRAIEDRAVREAIAMQESAGLDVVTDGELRRNSWVVTIPAPSWHRIFWHPEHSRAAYPTAEHFLHDVADYLRREVVQKIVALGGDYVQMDAPNYAQWHVDPDNRATFERWGHDMSAELIADAEVDDLVFAGIRGITRAIHVCRGNAPGGRWLANGGYERIAGEVFPRLTNYDRLLLEFDTPRAGGFQPLEHVREGTEVV